MNPKYTCGTPKRLGLIKGTALNGIEYLEVLDNEAPLPAMRQRYLIVRFANTLTGTLDASNVKIDGGVRVTPVKALWAAPATALPAGLPVAALSYFNGLPDQNNLLIVHTDSDGDFSTYTLRLVTDSDNANPPAGFDVRLASVDFSFKVECPSDFDCEPADDCPPVTQEEPELDYTVKDYSGFRRLMFDRLSLTVPQWKERNPADSGVALVELMAFVGDRLSYQQDAVATEAYLGTARKRVSIRRHARLLDYMVHEGCNARVWLNINVDAGSPAVTLPQGCCFITANWTSLGINAPVIDTGELADLGISSDSYEVFEPVWGPQQLYHQHNLISFYTWDDDECCLPAGATSATLIAATAEAPLQLAVGDVLIFQEEISPVTGSPNDADKTRRHAVRLTVVEPTTDLLNGVDVVNIQWADKDALPFPFCISATIADKNCQLVTGISSARGNVVLADHGLTVQEPKEWLPVQSEETMQSCEGGTLVTVSSPETYAPKLYYGPLTYRQEIKTDAGAGVSASELTLQDPRLALPEIGLSSIYNGVTETWKSRYDLLASDDSATEFVVETDTDGSARLRFGDNIYGRKPDVGTTFTPTYRVGNGSAGNVGLETIDLLVVPVTASKPALEKITNPLPAVGGADPETAEQVRQFAPQAFRRQERAVTEADYAEVAQRHPEVQKAAATFRWTGSWYTVFVTIDRMNGLTVDDAFKKEMLAHIEQYRLAGYDLEVAAPLFVPLDIAIDVCVKPGYFASNVKGVLLERFSNGVLSDGSNGFFHPDNFTFGQSVWLSQLYNTAMKVDGVASVEVVRFQRWQKLANHELENGVLTTDRLEIVQLDNDRNLPENGRIEFTMHGGV